MKKVLLFSIALIFSTLIGLVVPYYFEDKVHIDDFNNISVLNQGVAGYSDTNIVNYKIYDSGKLLGVVSNKEKLFDDIKNYDFHTDNDYDRNKIDLTDNIYIVEEFSKIIYENIDDSILKYLANNECIGIEAKSVEFSTDEGLYDKIFIANEEDFKKARDQFILNFISQDTLNKINRGERIDSPLSFGSVETGISIKQKMEISKGITTPDHILQNEKEIYEFLCYGHNNERQYYTTKQGDTLAGVGYYFKNMSAKQLMMLNPDIIKDENQIIEVGTVLNVTYYTSPLTITVSKERLAQEVVFPEATIYIEDKALPIGQSKVETEESNGIRNVLYTETWVNGVLQDGNEKSSVIVKTPTQGRVIIGAGSIIPRITAGSGNWRWPVSNPIITCDYYCYAGHGGVDFYNLYKPWDYVLAIDGGTIIDKGWTNIGGNYVRIDHHNGYITYYGHFSAPAYVEVGQNVSVGEILGPIGMTGNATGPHVHLAMYENGFLINPCSVLNCSLLY